MKKLLSLFTILCCVLTFASFPAIAVEASSEVVTFSDNFENETDTTPDNWQLFKETSTGVMTIETEDGNKFLRVNPQQNWASGVNVPGAVTKPGKVNVPTDGGIVVIKVKIRSAIVSASTQQNIKLSTYDVPVGNTNLLFATRDYGSGDSAIKDIFCFPTTSDGSVTYADSNFKISDNTWYDVTAMMDFSYDKVTYIVGNSTQGYRRHTINIAGSSLASLDAVTSVTLLMDAVSPNNYTDIDDISVSYLPKSLNFADTFEDATAGSTPQNWEDRAGVSTISVMEETGNKFVRVTKNANTTGVPQIATKDGIINIPMKDQYGKGIVVEAKIRQQNQSYRSLLMLNAPSPVTDSNITGAYGVPFFIHTNVQAYFMPGFTSGETFATLGEWFHYRAVIIPGETQTEIRHYFNDVHKATTTINSSTMPEIFNAQALYNIAFVWRHASQNPSAATDTGYMDFDDIKVYELKAPIYEVKVTNEQGAEIEDIENGTITVDAKVINNGTGRTVDVIGALYTKVGDTWKLTEAKKVINPDENDYLYAFAWRTGAGSLSLNVTDAENQMIKVFVWNRTADLDSDPSAFETSLRAIPVCAPIVID